jgi:ribosomal protein S27E
MSSSNNIVPLPAGRRHPRPRSVEPCPDCGAFLGRNYGGCAACYDAVERYWRADWEAFLAAERIAPGGEDEVTMAGVVVAEVARHPWTIADFAMTRVYCAECGAELGGGPSECGSCAFAFGNLWAPEHEAGATMNEHALRVGRWVVRHPHRHSATVAAGWRLNLPFLLTGGLPTTVEAQSLAAWLKAGGDPAELAPFRSPAEAYDYIHRPVR